MDFFDIAKKVAGRVISEAVNQATQSSYGNDNGLSKSIAQWDREWICIRPLKTANLTPYNHCVGLYRHVVDGMTMYVG